MKLFYLYNAIALAGMLVTGCASSKTGSTVEMIPKYTDAFDMRYGLFIHWVGCSPTQNSMLLHSDGSSVGVGRINEYAESIDVEKVADEAEALGFEYVIITDFHGLGTMLHPSAASDRWRGEGYAAKRDLIGEMIAALRKRGIGFILFTHPLDGHDYPPEHRKMLGWNDPTDGYKKWNDFINDIYAELAEKYGNEMMGMGFDSEFALSGNEEWTGKLDLKRLRKTILSKAPNLQLYGLTAPNDTCEFGHKEIWRADWHDPWKTRNENDYDVETWPAYRRVVSVVLPNHWATITSPEKGFTRLNAEQVYRYTVLQAAAATEGPGNAWAASPYSDGSWEKGVRELFGKVAEYKKPVRDSLARVYPSTSYPTPEGSQLSKLPRGIVATKATDDTVEYIHVLNPPDGKTLSLPAPKDGKKFTAAKLLGNGKKVRLTQNTDEVILALGENDSWDKLNTVIALDVDKGTIPRKNLALHKTVICSSTVDNEAKWPPKSDWGRIRLNDGERHVLQKPVEWSTGNYGWTSERTKDHREQWVGVDLGETRQIAEISLYPRDDEGNEGRGFPTDIKVEVSHDGKKWEHVVSKTMNPQKGTMQNVKFNPLKARYIRIVGTKLPQDPEDKLYTMQIVEMEVFEHE